MTVAKLTPIVKVIAVINHCSNQLNLKQNNIVIVSLHSRMCFLAKSFLGFCWLLLIG